MRIVWLTSYPKSGNTLLRFLLYNYLFGGIKSTRDLHSEIPDLHNLIASDVPLDVGDNINLLVKSHFLFSDQHPYSEQTASFIYVVRDPRDVILSNSRYRGAGGGSDIDRRRFIAGFIKNRGVKRWIDLGFGTWPGHVASWLKASETLPHLFIRFENLVANPGHELSRALRFLGAPVEPEKLAAAVEASSKKNMRKLEDDERQSGESRGIFGSQIEGNVFVGQGKSGQSFADLGDDVEQAYLDTLALTAGLFGYT